MCDKNDAILIGEAAAQKTRAILGEDPDAVVLYGSYARGDYDEESDVDIMIRINCSRERLNELRAAFIELADALSMEYGVEVSLSVTDSATYERYKNYLPYYENIESEGIKIA